MACVSYMLFEGLNQFWQTGLFSDVAVDTGHKLLPLHRVVLSAYSPVFQSMFTTDMRESIMKQIQIVFPCPKAFEEVLRFMYKGIIDINDDNVGDILYVADQLLMRDLVYVCADYISKRLDIFNCIDVMHLAESHSCPELKQSALKFICQNLAHVSRSLSFLTLPAQEVISLLDRDDLPCAIEEAVLLAALLWIHFDVSKRKTYAFDILSVVRFRSITLRELDYAMSCIELVSNTSFSVIMASVRRDLQFSRLFRTPRFDKPKRNLRRVLLFGGANRHPLSCASYASSAVQSYDTLTNTWQSLQSFKFRRNKHAMAVIGNRVYLIGGQHDYSHVTSSVECYDITTGVWTTLCSMLECRKEPMAVVVNGRIYVSSPDHMGKYSTVMEVYNPADDIWSPYSSNIGWQPAGTNVSRCYKDQLYEIVNKDGKCCIRVTPLFLDCDPNSKFNIGAFGDSEYPYAPLQYSKHDPAVVFLEDYLFLIGGYNSSDRGVDHIYGKFVDCLDLTQNKWRRVASLTYARSGHTAESLGGKIYVFGGQEPTLEQELYCMEIYDPLIDAWELRDQPTNFAFSASTTY